MVDVAPDDRDGPITLSDGVVELRPWRHGDAGFLYEASQDPAIERFNGPAPTSRAHATSVIEQFEARWSSFKTDSDPTGVAFVIVDAATHEPAGMCGVDDWSRDQNAQFGYWLAADARGRGLATRAAVLMTTWLFELGAARVFVAIRPENIASAAVARRAGLAFEGMQRDLGVRGEHRNNVDLYAALRVDRHRGSVP